MLWVSNGEVLSKRYHFEIDQLSRRLIYRSKFGAR
jgi:hypothetical protein